MAESMSWKRDLGRKKRDIVYVGMTLATDLIKGDIYKRALSENFDPMNI
jgi:hypothetical protein